MNISQLKLTDANPRYIRDEKFKKLCQSLEDFPEMLEVRKVIINEDFEVLAGNMRVRAALHLGWSTIPVQIVKWDKKKQQRFIIQDNIEFGDWDWDKLANDWDMEDLTDWGLELHFIDEDEQDDEETLESEKTVYIVGSKADIDAYQMTNICQGKPKKIISIGNLPQDLYLIRQ